MCNVSVIFREYNFFIGKYFSSTFKGRDENEKGDIMKVSSAFSFVLLTIQNRKYMDCMDMDA